MTSVPPAFDAWAPKDADWSAWVKPVPFAATPEAPGAMAADFAASSPMVPSWLPPPGDAALVLDLPGLDGILAALAVARRGYRPVPVYNSCTGTDELVQTRPLVWGLVEAADCLRAMPLSPKAPPAFILDARRLSGSPAPGRFDNRSVITTDDLPSAERLRLAGIIRVIVVRHSRSEDLAAVLRRWAEGGLAISGCESLTATPAPLDVRRRWFRSFLHRVFVWSTLRRSSAGGFGAVIPMSSGG